MYGERKLHMCQDRERGAQGVLLKAAGVSIQRERNAALACPRRPSGRILRRLVQDGLTYTLGMKKL
jgi:hypothetical protein